MSSPWLLSSPHSVQSRAEPAIPTFGVGAGCAFPCFAAGAPTSAPRYKGRPRCFRAGTAAGPGAAVGAAGGAGPRRHHGVRGWGGEGEEEMEDGER